MTDGMHHRTAQPHCRDPRRAGRQFGQTRGAGEPEFVDPENLPPLLRHLRVDERDAADDDPLPVHEAGPLHLHRERGEFLSQPRFNAAPNLLANTARSDRAGRDDAGDRDGHGPAHEHPECVGG